jgi:hypothetical protein
MRVVAVFIALVCISCSHKIDEKNLDYLNGYWEIDEAVMPDGSEKEYKVNPVIDYFELKSKKGIRKKVMPQFDGSYKVNGLSENIVILQQDDKTYISYTTDYAKWKEQIVKLDKEQLVLRNEQDIEYHYKKPQPFSIK